nr:hypothetical protein [Serratia marcescens]
MPSNDGYLQLVGLMKFIDQSISANTNYDPTRFPGGKVPMKQLLKDLLTTYKFGVKRCTTKTPATVRKTPVKTAKAGDDCESGACKI